jgi:hypothetical protein
MGSMGSSKCEARRYGPSNKRRSEPANVPLLEAFMKLLHPTQTQHPRCVRSSQRRRAALALAASAFLSLAATGCGSDGVLAPGVGTGSVTTSGAVSTSGSGLALFQSISSGGTSLFQVMVVPVSQTSAPIWQLQIVNYSGRPAAGTYNLSPLSASSTDPTANFYYTTGGTMDSYNSISGELVITSSSSSAVRGSFTFTATNAAGGTGSLTVSGSFNAQCAPGMTCQ